MLILMHHHECMLVVVGNAGLMHEALCDAIAFVDPRIAAATALIGSHRSRSRPDEQWMRGNPSDCMQKRWETGAILGLCVRPAARRGFESFGVLFKRLRREELEGHWRCRGLRVGEECIGEGQRSGSGKGSVRRNVRRDGSLTMQEVNH